MIRILAALCLALSLTTGCASFASLAKCMSQPDPQLHHAGDELLHLADYAAAKGIAPDSSAWTDLLGGLAGKLGRCVIAWAGGDLLSHLDTMRSGHEAAPCARCAQSHHADVPEERHRPYLERAAGMGREYRVLK